MAVSTSDHVPETPRNRVQVALTSEADRPDSVQADRPDTDRAENQSTYRGRQPLCATTVSAESTGRAPGPHGLLTAGLEQLFFL